MSPCGLDFQLSIFLDPLFFGCLGSVSGFVFFLFGFIYNYNHLFIFFLSDLFFFSTWFILVICHLFLFKFVLLWDFFYFSFFLEDCLSGTSLLSRLCCVCVSEGTHTAVFFYLRVPTLLCLCI